MHALPDNGRTESLPPVWEKTALSSLQGEYWCWAGLPDTAGCPALGSSRHLWVDSSGQLTLNVKLNP